MQFKKCEMEGAKVAASVSNSMSLNMCLLARDIISLTHNRCRNGLDCVMSVMYPKYRILMPLWCKSVVNVGPSTGTHNSEAVSWICQVTSFLPFTMFGMSASIRNAA